MSASGQVERTNAQARPAASARVTVRAFARYALPPELNMRTRAQARVYFAHVGQHAQAKN